MRYYIDADARVARFDQDGHLTEPPLLHTGPPFVASTSDALDSRDPLPLVTQALGTGCSLSVLIRPERRIFACVTALDPVVPGRGVALRVMSR